MNANTNTNTPSPVNQRIVVESNHMGGQWIDRIYKMAGANEAVELVNKNSTQYQGKIHRRRITVPGLDGQNFFAVAYESADGRWFDNCGMPIKKPTDVAKDSDEEISNVDILPN